jgi:hypothetical protein
MGLAHKRVMSFRTSADGAGLHAAIQHTYDAHEKETELLLEIIYHLLAKDHTQQLHTIYMQLEQVLQAVEKQGAADPELVHAVRSIEQKLGAHIKGAASVSQYDGVETMGGRTAGPAGPDDSDEDSEEDSDADDDTVGTRGPSDDEEDDDDKAEDKSESDEDEDDDL